MAGQQLPEQGQVIRRYGRFTLHEGIVAARDGRRTIGNRYLVVLEGDQGAPVHLPSISARQSELHEFVEQMVLWLRGQRISMDRQHIHLQNRDTEDASMPTAQSSAVGNPAIPAELKQNAVMHPASLEERYRQVQAALRELQATHPDSTFPDSLPY